MRSANTVSMIACWRWVMSASVTGSVLLVKNGWYRQTGNSSSSLVLVADPAHDQPGGDRVLGAEPNAVYSISATSASEINSPVSGSVTAPG